MLGGPQPPKKFNELLKESSLGIPARQDPTFLAGQQADHSHIRLDISTK
jgi:hypothetical protein